MIVCLFCSPVALFKAATAVVLQQCNNPEKQNPLFSKLGYSTIAFYMKLQLYIKECQKEGGSTESYLYTEKEPFFDKSL